LASTGSQASAKPASLTKLTVGLSGAGVAQFLPAWVAKDTGVYLRNGLDVDHVTTVGTTTMQALIANQLTLAVTGGPEILNATATDYAPAGGAA